jgi:SulP family sulfate permease
MPHRAHLMSLRLAHALRESLREPPYTAARLGKDCLAGMTVGLVSIPLAMALAIASGVPPQYGLYSAMIAGLLIPLVGGSRYSVSGPTAAFVVILFPIVQQYGFAGLLLATMLSGVLLVLMAVLRLGRYIEYIPQSVTLGFTCGIAIVIGVLQLPEFLNFSHQDLPPHFAEKALVIAQRITQFHTPSLLVGLATLAVLLLWPRLQSPIPPQLPALLLGLALGWLLSGSGSQIATIGNSFHYLGADGNLANGIPGHLPDFQWPWNRHLPNDPELAFTWQGAQDLLGAAFAIAMLGAIESLLCAVVLDGMSGIKHSANSELLGQGIGNIITPLFGGITATAAIARSAANFKAGAQTPIAAAIHALVVLLAVLTLAPLLSYLPMASMAALLLVVAWNMSEAHKAVHLVKTSPPSDVLVFATCLSLTVLFDMVIAISAGVLLASVLFVKQMAEMTRLADVSANPKYVQQELASRWKVFRINGPLFFAAADRIFGELGTLLADRRGIILSMEGVTILDAGGLAAMQKFIAHCGKAGVKLVLTDFEFQPLKALARSGFKPDGVSTFTFPTLEDALRHPLLSGLPEGVSDGPTLGAATL